MYLRKTINFLIQLIIVHLASTANAEIRPNSMSVMKGIQKQNFTSILKEKINPQMPPLFRGAVDDLIDSTVAIIGNNSNFGSGVLLKNSEVERLNLTQKFGQGYFIATVEHVISENQEYAVLFYEPSGNKLDETEIQIAKIIGSDPGKDLAILKIDSKPEHAIGSRLVSNNDNISIGDDVQAIGHPNEMWWTYTRGYVSQFRDNYEWKYDDNLKLKANVIQTQTPITTGNSGGPLFTTKGNILGLNAFGDPDFQSLNFAIAADEIELFINNLNTSLDFNIDLSSIIISDQSNWTKIEEIDSNNDGYIDVITYDTNNDGQVDLGEIDSNKDGITDYFEYDIFNDFSFAQTFFPESTEYYAEWRVDTDGDGSADLVAYDKIGNGQPDKLEKI
ncbi:trypsin-like peptidase domain-containing protein [Amylibacter sp.]|nr:trypsin-like peptidase domain-containing protein [Amylibacter sp.]